jgi:hypothetical protein
MSGRKRKAIQGIGRWLALGVLALVVTGCGQQAPTGGGGGGRLPDTFTFFDVDANTVDGEALRKTLEGHLGRGSFAGKDVLDLMVFSHISLDGMFPALGALNRALNPDPRARREHAITSLTYRYPQKHYPTFTYVRLVFSARHRHPLVIAIDANGDAGSVLETLTAKYGQPRVNRIDDPKTTLWSWEKQGDWLIVQKRLNRFDQPEYIIAIFYAARIRELLDAEARESDSGAPAGRNSPF